MTSFLSAQEMFYAQGISISDWATAHHFSAALVYAVLDGKRKCLRGQSHEIAIALGLKEPVGGTPRNKGGPLIVDANRKLTIGQI
jgi:gp16 family phage-associated protein